MALPTAVRDRLAGLILDALCDAAARRALASLAASGRGEAQEADGEPQSWFESRAGRELRGAVAAHGAAIGERARRGWLAVAPRPLDPRDAGLGRALEQAAVLFDAGLYFEVHELLEPHWRVSGGETRLTLQGLIQIAVGFEHLANANARGARALLRAGSAKVAAGDHLGRDTGTFARAVQECAERIGDEVDGAALVSAPRFPSKG